MKDEKITKAFGNRVSEAMKRKGWPLLKLNEEYFFAFGVSNGMGLLKKYKDGKATPNLTRSVRLAKLLNFSLDDLSPPTDD